MEPIRVEILNPKALQLLQNLADLNLISFKKEKQNSFADILKTLRSKSSSASSLEDITKEVEEVRSKRHGKLAKACHYWYQSLDKFSYHQKLHPARPAYL